MNPAFLRNASKDFAPPTRAASRISLAVLGLVALLPATWALAQNCVPTIGPAPLAPAPGGITPPAFFTLQTLAAADFNGDGRPDLVYVDGNPGQSVEVRMALPDGTFAPPVATTLGNITSSRLNIIADLDGDGILDFIGNVTNGSTTTRGVWYGHSDGTFTFGFDAGMNFQDTIVTDLNGDGRPDLVGFAVNSSGVTTGELRALINHGNRAFTSVSLATFANPGQVIVQDLDRDGLLDLFVVRIGSAGSAQCAFQAPPTQPGAMGVFQVQQATPLGSIAGSQAFLMDFDGDARLDIVVPSTVAYVTYCPGIVSAGRALVFGTPVNVDPFPSTFRGNILQTRAALADVNGDGRLDMVRQLMFTNSGQAFVGVKFASAGQISGGTVFSAEIDFPGVDMGSATIEGDGPRVPPPVVDLNGDGLPEILATGPDILNSPVPVNAVALTVTRAASVVIDSGPTPAHVRAGQAATVSVVAHPTSVGTTLGYRWLKNGIALAESARVVGTHTPTLTISNTSSADAGVYSVEVTTACDTRTATTFIDVGNTGAGCVADIDDGSGTGTSDGGVTIDDLLFFLAHFEQGC